MEFLKESLQLSSRHALSTSLGLWGLVPSVLDGQKEHEFLLFVEKQYEKEATCLPKKCIILKGFMLAK